MSRVKLLFKSKAALLLIVIEAAVCSISSCWEPESKPWSFGVMSDTHWSCPTDPEGINSDGVSVSIINQINDEFINKGVKFVIQVGDLANATGKENAHATRAAAAKALYDKGIGFFPTRGNHDLFLSSGYGISTFKTNFPQTKGTSNTFGTYDFSSPAEVNSDLDGLSYAFNYGPCWNSATFIIVDVWETPTKQVNVDGLYQKGYVYGYSVGDQMPWISSRLDKNTRNTKQAFVFGHQNIMPEYHYDCLFSGYANSNIEMQNEFFSTLKNNDVKYYVSGHEHFYNRSMITSPDGNAAIQDLICTSSSSKVLAPQNPASANFFDQKTRQMQIAQELNTIGYFIFTVDGPRVTVDYYSDDHGSWMSDANWPTGTSPVPPFINQVTPVFNFVKKDTCGYSLNGKEFIIARNQEYTSVEDEYYGTSAKILGGFNGSDTVDKWGRALTKIVNTGWTKSSDMELNSNILTLWGMAGFGSDETDTYTLSMTYYGKAKHAQKGSFGISTMDSDGNWLNAVDMNYGGIKKFVKGPWKPEYGLGTYGIDPKTNTAWAVINYNSQFAVAQDI